MPGPFLSKQGGKNPLHPHLHACTPGCRLLEHPDVRPPYTRMFTDKCSEFTKNQTVSSTNGSLYFSQKRNGCLVIGCDRSVIEKTK